MKNIIMIGGYSLNKHLRKIGFIVIMVLIFNAGGIAFVMGLHYMHGMQLPLHIQPEPWKGWLAIFLAFFFANMAYDVARMD